MRDIKTDLQSMHINAYRLKKKWPIHIIPYYLHMGLSKKI